MRWILRVRAIRRWRRVRGSRQEPNPAGDKRSLQGFSHSQVRRVVGNREGHGIDDDHRRSRSAQTAWAGLIWGFTADRSASRSRLSSDGVHSTSR